MILHHLHFDNSESNAVLLPDVMDALTMVFKVLAELLVTCHTSLVRKKTAQYSSIHKKEYRRRSQPPITIPNELPKPDFMPTKLVRISDMKVVDGSQVNEGYCALSYSWDQSGDIQQDDNGKYVRVDDGKHKIISYDGIFPDMIIPRYKTPVVYNYRIIERGSKLEKMYYVLKIIDDENYYFSKTIQYVKFEVIIQQICQQFNIKYIWYDQMCINQDDKKEKQHEMRNMHQIYQNAYCTVAFIPDHSHKKHLYASRQQYFRHIWTLEEVINSERLLLVGGDKHEWGDQIGTHREEAHLSSAKYHLVVNTRLSMNSFSIYVLRKNSTSLENKKKSGEDRVVRADFYYEGRPFLPWRFGILQLFEKMEMNDCFLILITWDILHRQRFSYRKIVPYIKTTYLHIRHTSSPFLLLHSFVFYAIIF
ncbi:hypothetical protein BDA99DRAFT_533983 [Phascolomyces articulosus]|uniref:Heterokaryon incompatibility domain-containing protein n=1 Tax=Phascolomyces articulosus TaxID=60185 RepID=A0AAD5PIH7_9FUNG|nr:hypothetical protein BDA99DRAFT_533983 [Phascolomyces articulosus]